MVEALSSSIRSMELSSDCPSPFRPVIAAIDFGTSSSGYAFAIRRDEKQVVKSSDIRMNKWQIGIASSFTDKALTTVLLKPDRTFDSFGYKAEDKYAKLCATNKHKGWWFFDKFKMELYITKKLSRETNLYDAEGKEMPAINVFSVTIAYLKSQLFQGVKAQNPNFTDDDILYILTVPAIWSDAAKQFMREAATSKEVGIKDNQLKLVLEPEAASVYCRQTLSSGERRSDGTLRLKSLPVGYQYIIADLGGGTADIATHQIVDNDFLHEISCARGDDLGGQTFNRKFLEFLGELFGEEIFRRWETSELGGLVKLMRSIEGLKWDISDSEDDVLLKIPQSLSEFLRKEFGQYVETTIPQSSLVHSVEMCVEGNILLSNATAKEFFSDIVVGIEKHLLDITRDVPKLQTIFLVGGMAKSSFVRDHIKSKFPTFTVIVPEDPGVAVLKGAVLLGDRPQTIAGRIARYSYGIGITQEFVEGKHREEYKFTRDGEFLCRDVFEKLIEKGQVLQYGQRFTTKTSVRAKLPETKQATFRTYLYQSTQPSPMYVTDDGCCELGGFDKLPPEGGWPDYCESKVEIIVGEAEFKLVVSNDLGRKYETISNYLSSRLYRLATGP